MKRCMNVVMWVLAIFMAVGALVYIPSAASIIMFLFAVIAAPINPLQSFFKSKGLSGVIKGVLLTVLFFVAIALAPTSEHRTAKSEEKKSISDNVDRNTAASNSSGTKSDDSQEKEKIEEEIDPDQKLKNDILSYLQENGVEDPKITVLENRVDIKTYTDYSNECRPEEWDSIVEKSVTLCKTLKDELAEPGGKSVSIVKYGSNDTILLTVIDGKCTHNLYDSLEKDNQEEDATDIDAIMDMLLVSLSQNFGEGNYTLEYDDTTVTLNLWGDNVAIGAAFAANGDESSKELWDTLVESHKDMCNNIMEEIKSCGIENYSVKVNVLNDLNNQEVLLTILNGEVVHDAVSSGKAAIQSNEDTREYDNTSKTESSDSTESNNYTGRTIYITNTGEKYHYDNNCNGGTYFSSTLNEALRLGLTPCSKCVN